MEALHIEILNPKAWQLIKGMQDLNLIRIEEGPAPAMQAYLRKMRRKAATAPTPKEIGTMVEAVRKKRHASK
jgi:hypothetical protein